MGLQCSVDLSKGVGCLYLLAGWAGLVEPGQTGGAAGLSCPELSLCAASQPRLAPSQQSTRHLNMRPAYYTIGLRDHLLVHHLLVLVTSRPTPPSSHINIPRTIAGYHASFL